MRTVAIIQARMGSSRLPGKVLEELRGKSMLQRVVERVRRARLLADVIVATSTRSADDVVAQTARAYGAGVFRGSEDDVLDRYYHAAVAAACDVVVRITSDCPLIDPEEVDRVVALRDHDRLDYASNSLERSFPRGLDAEAFTFAALERAHREAREPYQRAHVTPYLYQHPEVFRLGCVRNAQDLSHHRWTVDTPEDLELVRALLARLPAPDHAGWREVLRVVEAEPGLSRINAHVEQKPLHQG